jgi:hypothetical protein
VLGGFAHVAPDVLLFWLAVTGYAAAAAVLIGGEVFARPRIYRFGSGIVRAALAVHTIALASRWMSIGHGPYVTRFEIFSSDVWVGVFLLEQVIALYPSLRILKVLSVPVCVLLLGMGAMSPGVILETPVTFRSWWLAVHIGFGAVMLVSLVASAGCAAALVAGDKLRALFGVPAAATLEKASHRCLLVAFLFLSIGIATGLIWALRPGISWRCGALEIWILASWLGIGALLLVRRLRGLGGRPWVGWVLSTIGVILAGVLVIAETAA